MSAVENPPAFPTIGSVAYNSDWQTEHGMTLRDWFAGQALAGLLGNSNRIANEEGYAEQTYLLADAMLAERAKDRP